MAAQSTASLALNGVLGEVAISSMPVPGGDFSISLWIKTTDTSSDRGLFGRWDTVGFMLYSTGSALSFYSSDGGGGQNISWSGGWASVADGSWHNLIATKATTTGTIYLDGVNVYSASGLASTNGSPSNSGNLGTYTNRAASRIAATFDDIALLGFALTSGQAAAIAGNPAVAGSSTLDVGTLTTQGLWRAETGSGITLFDTSGNGHDGVISNIAGVLSGASWSSSVPLPLQAAAGGVVPYWQYAAAINSTGGA